MKQHHYTLFPSRLQRDIKALVRPMSRDFLEKYSIGEEEVKKEFPTEDELHALFATWYHRLLKTTHCPLLTSYLHHDLQSFQDRQGRLNKSAITTECRFCGETRHGGMTSAVIVLWLQFCGTSNHLLSSKLVGLVEWNEEWTCFVTVLPSLFSFSTTWRPPLYYIS